jgi:predicted ribosome quality control (RQC) complex YloA/Tae2 family protein
MFDALTTAALADQLATEIQNARVQQVGMISRQSLWMEIYANRRRRHLIISIEPGRDAVYLQDEEPVFDRQLVTPLLLLLRKYVRGGRIVGIQQPPLERILHLTIARRLAPVAPVAEAAEEPDLDEESDQELAEDDDDEDVTFVDLVFEIMGRHSNILLVDDDGRIMESAKRVTTAMSRVRPISPKLPYVPPPARDGLDPRRVTAAALTHLIEATPDRKALLRRLPGGVIGLSPQIATEAVYLARAGSEDWPIDLAVLAREIRRLFEPLITGTWQPVVYRDEESRVIAYATQPLRHLGDLYAEEQVESISEAIRLGAGLAGTGSDAGRHAVRANRLAARIESALSRARAKLEALRAEEERHQNREQLREWGELIYGYLWQIKPGDTELVVDGTRVPLDPRLDPKTQARKYLEEYRTGQQADVQIERVRATTERDVAYLDQLHLLAQQAVAIEDIEDIEREWRARGQAPVERGPRPRSSARKRTRPVETVNGNDIFVGRSGADNDHITFDVAGQDDTWLHARGVPGSHVIVRWCGHDREDEATLMRAAEIAAWFSKSRSSGRVEVDITARRHVRKIKGSGPGLVTYQNERTVSVRPAGPD